jgi:hypothetical protein
MRVNAAGLCLSVLLGAGLCSAQNAPAPPPARQPDASLVYCSGFVTDQKVPDEMRLISGEQSNYKVTFGQGDYVYINRGVNQGVKVGDEFSVLRPTADGIKMPWFRWQNKLMKVMGTPYSDLGRIRVVVVQPKVSIAQVVFNCDFMQRGDILQAFQERPAPTFKDPSPFDHFAAPSAKPVAMVVSSTGFHQSSGTNDTIFVNLGVSQGVKVGDYFRVFRYEGSRNDTMDPGKDYQFKLWGFGSTPTRYNWDDLPREVLGEGIVLNVSRNSSTVLLTYSTIEIYAGDYVEIE